MIFPSRKWLRIAAVLAGSVVLLAAVELYRRETAFSAAEDGLRLQWEGEAQRALERFQTAELLSRHAFWDSDVHAAALYGVGISYADLKRYDEAETTLRDAIPRLEAVLGGANPRLAVAYKRLDAVIREKKGAAR